MGGRRRGWRIQPHFPGDCRFGLPDFVRHFFVFLQHVWRGSICHWAVGAGVVSGARRGPTGQDIHGEPVGVECVGNHLRDHQPVVDDHERQQPEQHFHVPELRRGVSGRQPNAAHLAVQHPPVYHDSADSIYRKAGGVRGRWKHHAGSCGSCRRRRTGSSCGMGRDAGGSGQRGWRRRRWGRWRRRGHRRGRWIEPFTLPTARWSQASLGG